MEKNSFVMYTKYEKDINKLNPEQRGYLLSAIMAHVNGHEIPELDLATDILFGIIVDDIDACSKKYEEAKKARSNAGKRSAEARSSSNKRNQRAAENNKTEQNLTNDNKAEQTSTNSTDNVNDNVNVNDKDKNIISSDEDIRDTAVSRKHSTADVQKVVDTWNALPSPIPKIQKMVSGSPRENQLKARIRQYGLDEVLVAIEKVKTSPFLLGQRTDFVIKFDWFIGPKNFAKVLDGNYDDDRRPTRSRDKPSDKRITAYSDYASDYNYDDLERQLANCENN